MPDDAAGSPKMGEAMNSVRSYDFSSICAREKGRSHLGRSRLRVISSVEPCTIWSEVRRITISLDPVTKRVVDVEV